MKRVKCDVTPDEYLKVKTFILSNPRRSPDTYEKEVNISITSPYYGGNTSVCISIAILSKEKLDTLIEQLQKARRIYEND